MNRKIFFFNLARCLNYIVMLIITLYMYIASAYANEKLYKFHEIAQLNHGQTNVSQWLQLVNHPSNTEKHFAINQQGQMYFVDNTKQLREVLNLNNNLQTAPIQITALALHPNFALRDQLGFGTFYTAHIETFDEKSTTKRIRERDAEIELKNEAVITEWRFNTTNYQIIDLKTKREVIRIAVPDESVNISQMSFNPYTKSWNDGFGLLYIALNGKKELKEPLYSGVLLRINPAKFGLRSYTVPTSNPFVKEADIKDEIYLLGAQNIKQFIWPDKSSDEILISHYYEGQSQLSLTSIKNDWRTKTPERIVYQTNKLIEGALLYRGRNLSYLRNKLILLTKSSKEWSIESLNANTTDNREASSENISQLEWNFSEQQLALDSEGALTKNRNGEILILDKKIGNIFQISQENVNKTNLAPKKVTIVEEEDESNNLLYVVFSIVIVIAIVLYLIKRNQVSAKAILRKQYAQIELSESKKQIGFYHRHESNVSAILDIANIDTCEILLNENTINVIDRNVNNGFDNEKEQDLRAAFSKEKVDKLIDNKIRQISLNFIDKSNKEHLVCLYMRKGSNRVTKKTYLVVLEDLFDWCWLISSQINPKETGVRKKKPTIISAATARAKVQKSPSKTSSSNKENYKPVGNQKNNVEKHQTNNALEKTDTKEKSHETQPIDTELVNALEKLVDLRKNGFLTEEEFTKAKVNLLRSLS